MPNMILVAAEVPIRFDQWFGGLGHRRCNARMTVRRRFTRLPQCADLTCRPEHIKPGRPYERPAPGRSFARKAIAMPLAWDNLCLTPGRNRT